MKAAAAPSYKLAFVVSSYFPWGGLQRDLKRIALRCSERGHQVHVLTGRWEGERPAGLGVHELDTRALTNHGRNDRLSRGVRRAVAPAAASAFLGKVTASGHACQRKVGSIELEKSGTGPA